jgi:hypothetical protein
MNMKYLITLMLALATFGASAQSHLSESFLNVKSLQVSNVAAVSNLTMFVGMSNIFGGRWTNNAGVAIDVTNAGNTVKVLRDVRLWADRDGNVPIKQIASVPGTQTNYLNISPFTISGRFIGGAGANSAVTFVFTPFWKDIGEDGNTFVASTHDFSFAVTAVASSVVTFATNVTAAVNWAGAKGVRVRSIVNADTDFTGGIYITDLDLSGFRP